MPYKKPKIEKLLYSIGEVAQMFDVNVSLIRFWEQKFDIIKPVKNKKGNRQFTPKDIDNFRLIFHLTREKGLTLQGAQKKLKDSRKGTLENFEIVKRLQDIKSELIEIREQLDTIEYDNN